MNVPKFQNPKTFQLLKYIIKIKRKLIKEYIIDLFYYLMSERVVLSFFSFCFW